VIRNRRDHEKADWILKNAIVLTMDENFQIFNPGAVAVIGDSIVAVNHEKEIEKDYQSEQVLDCQGKILMPGLINAHTHVPMTLLRGLADDLRLDVWLMGYMMPVEREFVSPEFVRLGTQLACAESIRSGVTTFVDMYYFEHDVAEATAEAGLRAVCSQTVLKFPPQMPPIMKNPWQLLKNSSKPGRSSVDCPSVGPHAPYTCTDEILQACSELAQKYDVPLHIHLAETAGEVENIRKEHGMPVCHLSENAAFLMPKVIAAHCVHIDEGEMRTIQHAGAGIATIPPQT
jgi:5-methylthioadenosine/S-adenosylhomocysteine deaminase